MNEKEKTSIEQWLRNWLKIKATTMALLLTLTGCGKIEELRIKHLEQKVKRLEATLEMQADNYGSIADQHNVQLNIREEWADETINQDIFLSWELGLHKDDDISETTTEYRAAKKKLMELKEKQGKWSPNYTDPAWKMNPKKYEYKKRIYRPNDKNNGSQKKAQKEPQEESILTRWMND